MRQSFYLYVYLSLSLSSYLSFFLSVYLCICLFMSIYLSVYLSVYSICLSVYLLVYLSNYLSFYLSVYLWIYLSIYLSFYLFLAVCLSIYLSVCFPQSRKLTTAKTKQFCETSFNNDKLTAELTASCKCVLRFFHPISLKYCALPRKSETRSYKVLPLSRKIILGNLKIWCSKTQPLSGLTSSHFWWRCLLHYTCHAKCMFTDPPQTSHACHRLGNYYNVCSL